MEKKEYHERVADRMLSDTLEAMGAVLIEGPKWCGKTTTAEHAANSVLYMSDTDTSRQVLQVVNLSPRMILNGTPPMLIDEWQEAPRIWDAVRHEVDHRDGRGLFILTGSAVPDDERLNEIHHTGTGRIARLTMRPMSLWESGDSEGSVCLSELFDGKTDLAAYAPKTSLRDIAYLMCRGGWPETTQMKNERAALKVAREYYKAVVNTDISRVNKIQKNPDRVRRLMRSYARHQGASVSLNAIAADIANNEAEGLSADTVSTYIEALKRIFVIEDAVAWNPNLRSKTAIRSSDTRYFIDPSIASCALEVGPDDFLADLNTMGLVFETMAIRDLRCYADALEGKVYHYRDANGLECDAVVHLYGGRYGLVEVKLGGDKLIDEGAATLKRLASVIDTDKMRPPSFMMVLTALGDYAYRRADDVLVVPIRSLRV